MSKSGINSQERVQMLLRAVYKSCGYLPFKVNKFEEYDLYAQNKNFINCKQVLTFNNPDGRLMALKPDVTLSIIRSTTGKESLRKVFYIEDVYRVPSNGDGFSEIPQMGLECIGELDRFAVGEVVMLAAKSLAAISEKYILDISHMGVISGILKAATLSDECRAEIFDAVSARNEPELEAIGKKYKVDEAVIDILQRLIRIYGPIDKALAEIGDIPLPECCGAVIDELAGLTELLRLYDVKNVNLDFSVVNDTEYYSGFVFRGFIDGISTAVISGGEYSKLISKMGKTGGAIGFAVYLDRLERLLSDSDMYDVDTLVIYKDDADIPASIKTADDLRHSGESVRVQKKAPDNVTFRHKIIISNGETVENA